MHPQNHDRGIIVLASSRKLIHRCEDRVDNAVSGLRIAFGYSPSETLDSPLLADRVYRFNHPVRVGEEQITGRFIVRDVENTPPAPTTL
jgi:hypothetical protein